MTTASTPDSYGTREDDLGVEDIAGRQPMNARAAVDASEERLCGCDRPDQADDPHRHNRDGLCNRWAEVQANAPGYMSARRTFLLELKQKADQDAVEHGTDPDQLAATIDRDGYYPLRPLPPELVDGLTTWGDFGGAQMRVENPLLYPDGVDPVADPDAEPLRTDAGSIALGPPVGVLYLHIKPSHPQSPEDGHPWRFDTDDARRLRDLLNLATARGIL
jgi:hypothetical protein